jgi:predicted HTH transcriptional regulator
MRDAMLKSNLPLPEFKESETHAPVVRVVLRNNIEHRKAFLDENAVRIIGEGIFDSLNENEKMIVNCFAERQTINIADASRVIGKGWQATKKILNDLVEKGVLLYISPLGIDRDPKAHYILRSARGNGQGKGR